MQYILSEEEYQALTSEADGLKELCTKELQTLCTLAAQHIPIARDGSLDKAPKPWGCILGPHDQHPGHCGKCPARKVCPHTDKVWSEMTEALRPCRSPYCECSADQCSHPGCYDARGTAAGLAALF